MSWNPGFSVPTPNPGDDVNQEGGGDDGSGGLDSAAAQALIDASLVDQESTLLDTFVASDDVRTIVSLTQAEYDLLDPPSATTLYVVVPA